MVKLASYWNKPPTQSAMANIEAFKQMVTPPGIDYKQYIQSKMAPKTPIHQDINAMYDSDAGDKGYEAEQILNRYQTPAGKAQMDGFYQKNSLWYNPDGSRTDHMMSPLDKEVIEWKKSGRVGVNPVAAAVANFRGNPVAQTTAAQKAPGATMTPATPAPAANHTPQPFNSPFNWNAGLAQPQANGAAQLNQSAIANLLQGRKSMSMFGNSARNGTRKLRNRGAS